MEAAVHVDGLWEGYRPKTRRGGLRRREWHWALRDVSLHVEPGEMLGVVGGNGSGKTTLLRTIAGVLSPTRGVVAARSPVSSLIDLTAGLARDLTGYEHLLIGGVLLGLSRAQVRARFDQIVAFTGLRDELLSEPLHTYSAGMILRLASAVVLNTDPAVLLVDEVLAVGDEAFHAQCLERIAQFQSAGCAVVLVSHHLDLVEAHASRVAVLDGGELRFCGLPTEAVRRYREIERAAVAAGQPERLASRPQLRPAAHLRRL